MIIIMITMIRVPMRHSSEPGGVSQPRGPSGVREQFPDHHVTSYNTYNNMYYDIIYYNFSLSLYIYIYICMMIIIIIVVTIIIFIVTIYRYMHVFVFVYMG